MKPGFRLELVQSQKLVLTPELLQAISVLQMNALELTEYIKRSVEENPLLEITGESQGLSEPLTNLEAGPTKDEEWLSYFCDSLDPDVRIGTRLRNAPVTEYTGDRSPTLRKHLSSQLGLLELSYSERALGEFIIGNLDDNGYLTCSIHEMSVSTGFSHSQIQRILDLVKTLDPPGVGARDLRECLLLQAEAKGLSEVCKRVISESLDDLAGGRLRKIAHDLRISLKEVLMAQSEILLLNPKPGASFAGGLVKYIVPDIIVRQFDEHLVVVMNDSAFPRVGWNSFYKKMLSTGDDRVKDYLQERLHKAKSLLQSIEQRRTTVMRVMENVVSKQKGFFAEGDFNILPLTLKDVARDVGLHESTVSRALSNKYVDTPYGIYPCKMFFSPRVQSCGEEVSQHLVKRLIKDMVDGEDKAAPLSDHEIVDRLEDKGVHVARRTVAKYRTALGIAPSSKRRRL